MPFFGGEVTLAHIAAIVGAVLPLRNRDVDSPR
jgi:hypothetical protein